MRLVKLKVKRPNLFYGWIVVVACFFVAAAGGGIHSSLGIYFEPLEDAFGWSRTLISSSLTIYVLGFGVSTYICGRLADKYGPRLPLIGGGIFMGLGLSLCSQAETIWQLYVGLILAGMGSGTTLSLPTGMVQHWFMKRRGLVLGVVFAGVGFGGLVFAPMTHYLISSFGWRMAFFVEGLLALIVFTLAALVIVIQPEKKGLKPYGAGEVSLDQGSASTGGSKVWTTQVWSTGEAVRTKAFWALCILSVLLVLPHQMVVLHVVKHAIDVGVPGALAAGAVGLIGGISIAGRIVMGLAVDRIGWKTALVICSLGAGAAVTWLVGIKNSWMLYVFVVLYGSFFGGAIPQVPGLIGFFFGPASVIELIGLSQGMATVGSCAGPLIAGYVWDKTGSYAIAFSLAAASLIIAAIMAILVKPPRKAS